MSPAIVNEYLLKLVPTLYDTETITSLSEQACYIRCKNLALNIRDCVSLSLSEETLKAVGPFYLVSMPGESKYHV